MKTTAYWAMVAGLLCTAVWSAEPPAPPGSPAAKTPGAPAGTPHAGAGQDEDLIEFLGADDVGDAAWWEFLKNSAPRNGQSPVRPPQGNSP